VPGTEFVEDCDLLLLAMGFVGPERSPLLEALGVELDLRGHVRADTRFATNVPSVFVAGDAHRGASLIVWAIAEGRAAARAIDLHLMGTTTLQPV
jgi:glutamate synthase (NADPH/NADH) small chain